MTEIEKMFENVGIKKVKDYYCPYCETKLEDWFGKQYICPNDSCNYALCDDEEDFQERLEHLLYREKYPPFTADKQLAILKLLTQQRDLTISHFTKWEFLHFDGQEPMQVTGKDFVETFAKLINAYWQDLTDQEKKEIRRILNENS